MASGDGEIVGTDIADGLIGDVGGTGLENQIANIVLILDTSDSMDDFNVDFGGNSVLRIEALDLAVEALLDQLVSAPGATVRVHMVNFATDVKDVATFTIIQDGVVDATALQDAKNFVINDPANEDPFAVADGFTNYEAGFDAALDWWNGNTTTDPLANADFNQTLFISDGAPNRVLDGNGDPVNIPGSPQSDVDEVLGSDGSNEFQGIIDAGSSVDAIGLDVGASALGILNQVDEGNADNVTSGDQLAQVLQDLSPLALPSGVGDDVINGGGGDDLIFGDSIFTDLVADDAGIQAAVSPATATALQNLPDGSGWLVMQELISDGFFPSP